MTNIYLDYGAATPVDKRVLRRMQPYWRGNFANPSSLHKDGVRARNAVNKAREEIAQFLHAHDREIIFTSGGTEANNLALSGIVRASGKKLSDIHIITTPIEHASILETVSILQKEGVQVSFVPVDGDGVIDLSALRDCIRPETLIISIGYANSEIGTVQPIKEIMKIVRHARNTFSGTRYGAPYVHIDASAAGQYLSCNVEELGVDLLTLDAQKLYGPKGIGILYVRDGVSLAPIIYGGGQENERRSGTENLPLIVGCAEACMRASEMREKEHARLLQLRDWFFSELKKKLPETIINGSQQSRLPNNINISFFPKGIYADSDGEMMVLRLDERGITASSASACASGSGESKVVRYISESAGIAKDMVKKRAVQTLRFTLGRDTRKCHLKKLLGELVHLAR